MAAIFGLFHLDASPAIGADLDAMMASLAHRGQDRVGMWLDGPVGLGARFDVLTPEAAGAPPVATTPNGRFAAVADARLDDRASLARTLEVSPALSDADLIVRAVARWGDEAPRHLVGDFAFAVWDAEARSLFCARDRMGVRPFYYLHEPGHRFAFATEIRALQALPGFPVRLDEAHLADYLLVTLDHTSTFFRDVRRLQAATTMGVTAAGASRSSPYWQPDADTELRLPSDEAYAEGFRALFDQAVADRMRSTVRVGAALSGGLDSSSIAVVARDLASEPLPVFSAQFAGLPDHLRPLSDERAYVEAVVETGRFDLHVLEATGIGPFTDYERMSWHLEDNFRTINLYLHWGLFDAARRAGVRVFLDGNDGDTVVSHGYDRFSELALQGDWAGFVAQARAFPDASTQRWFAWHYGAQPLAAALRRGQIMAAYRGARALRDAFGFGWRRLGGLYAAEWSPSARRAARNRAFAAAFIRPDFAQRTDAWARHAASQVGPAATEREGHARGLRSPLFPLMLEMADRAAAAFGVEMRYPFFDVRLMTYCLSLPAEQKLDGGVMRRVMRGALAGRLPEVVRNRSDKANLKPNFDLKLAQHAARELEPFLFGSDAAVAPYVDLGALRAAYRAFLADPIRHSHTGTHLYAIASLERGLRRLGLG